VNIDDIAMENEDFFTLIDKEQSEEEITALKYCMETLTVEQQISVKLFYYENLSYADIVEQTGYILSKVKSYIQNGKRNLKSCIIKVLKTNQ
jgi:RNA polymerase sigma-70 factor (ECF subfamily)